MSDLHSVASELRRLGEKIDALDFSPVLEAARDEMAVETQESFMQSRTPSGLAWAPPKRPLRRRLLIKTGALMASALQTVMGGRITPKTLTVDADDGLVSYGPFHRHGTSRMPARNFIELTAQVRQQAQKKAAELMQQAFTLGG